MSQLGRMPDTVMKRWHSRRWFEGFLLVSEKCTTPCNMEGQATREQCSIMHGCHVLATDWAESIVVVKWMLIQSGDVLTGAWTLATCVSQPGSCGMSDMCSVVHNRLQQCRKQTDWQRTNRLTRPAMHSPFPYQMPHSPPCNMIGQSLSREPTQYNGGTLPLITMCMARLVV